jgi:pilus assembly protein Flp/PilA
MGSLRTRRGQGLVEYSLILSLIFVVVVLAVILLGNTLKNTYQNISCSVATHQACP